MHPVLVPVGATVVLLSAWLVGTLWSGEGVAASCRGAATDLDLTVPSEVGTLPLADEQIAHADTIVRTTMADGRTPRAATLALATAMQESTLRNLAHGDEAGPDSRGLFQQRLRFYGDVDVMDPASATRAFLDRLHAVPGWEAMAPEDAIQSVQRAAYPERYADWVAPAERWTAELWRHAEDCTADVGTQP